jgi:hypothetical protein
VGGTGDYVSGLLCGGREKMWVGGDQVKSIAGRIIFTHGPIYHLLTSTCLLSLPLL